MKSYFQLKDQTFAELIHEIKPSKNNWFSTSETDRFEKKLEKDLPDDCCIVIGGFQKGHFSTNSIQKQFDKMYHSY